MQIVRRQAAAGAAMLAPPIPNTRMTSPPPPEPAPAVRLALVTQTLTNYRNRFYDEVARRLIAAGGAATIFAHDMAAYDPARPRDFYLGHLRVVEMPAWSGKNGWLSRNWPNPALWQRLDDLDPTHLWMHEFSPYVLPTLLWARVHGRPCVVSTEIGERFTAIYNHPNKTFQNFIKRRCAGVIAHTAAARETAERLGRPVVFSPHSIDTSEYLPRDPHARLGARLRLLQVGLLIERKGVDLLLAAFRRCVEAGITGLELVLRGEGDRPWVEGLIRGHGLGGQVSVQPFARGAELIETYRQADIFVHAAREDTYAVVVHEAAACGLPLVVSRYAGASETMVEEGRTGLVVDPYDTEAFSAALLRLAADGDLRRSFGERARARAELFTVQENAAKVAAWLPSLGGTGG